MNKQFLAYILISVVFVIVFGGIASILPSRHERQLGTLRVAARKLDLEISLVQIADVNASLSDRVTAGGIKQDPKKRCVAWSKRYPDKFAAIPEWINYASDQDEPAQLKWRLSTEDQERSNLPHSYWLEVSRITAQLPAHCIALECTHTEIRWLGYESLTSTADEFIQAMVQGLDALMQLNISVAHAQSALEKHLDTSIGFE